MAAGRRVAKLADVAASLIIVVALLWWNLDMAKAYDNTVLESGCSVGWESTDARRLEIQSVTNTLISGVKPGPPSAYVCAIPDPNDNKPDVWAWASCAESLTQADCRQCVQDARDWLTNTGCTRKPGGHLYYKDCSIEYEGYAICQAS